MDALPQSWISAITEALFSFLRSADIHTVMAISVVSLLCKYFLWPHWKWPIAYLAFVPLALSFAVTPMMSLTDEVQWGGKWFFRQTLYNGIVSEALFHIGLPYCQRRWPALFALMETKASE